MQEVGAEAGAGRGAEAREARERRRDRSSSFGSAGGELGIINANKYVIEEITIVRSYCQLQTLLQQLYVNIW